MRVALDRSVENRRTVDTRKPQVGDDDVEGEVRQFGEGRLARVGLFHLIATIAKLLGDGFAERRLVFDQQ